MAIQAEKPRRSRLYRLIGASLAIAPTALITIYSMMQSSWRFFFSDTHSIHFTDLRPITANLSCRQSDPLWSIDGPSCDPWQRLLNYPKIWLEIFDFFGLNDRRVGLAGALVAMALLSGILLALYSTIRSPMDVWLGLMLSLSPPVMFLLERGNVDGLIFFLLVASCLAVASSRLWLRILGVIGIAFASLLKIFPVGALVVLYFISRRCVRSFWRATALIGALAIGIGMVLAPEAPRIFANTPSFPGMQFGSRALPIEVLHCFPSGTTYGYCDWNPTIELAVGATVILVSIGLILVLDRFPFSIRNLRAGFWSSVDQSAVNQAFFVVFGSAYLMAFLLGTSWYYRLVFLIPVAVVSRQTRTSLGSWVVVAVLVSLYAFAGNVVYLLVLGQVASMAVSIVIGWLLAVGIFQRFCLMETAVCESSG